MRTIKISKQDQEDLIEAIRYYAYDATTDDTGDPGLKGNKRFRYEALMYKINGDGK